MRSLLPIGHLLRCGLWSIVALTATSLHATLTVNPPQPITERVWVKVIQVADELLKTVLDLKR